MVLQIIKSLIKLIGLIAVVYILLSMTIYSAVLIGCQRVTDGQTDGRTDVKPIAITCFSIADARKNRTQAFKWYYFQ